MSERRYHKVAVGRESFDIDARCVIDFHSKILEIVGYRQIVQYTRYFSHHDPILVFSHCTVCRVRTASVFELADVCDSTVTPDTCPLPIGTTQCIMPCQYSAQVPT